MQRGRSDGGDLQDFLYAHVESFEQLDTLLALHRVRPAACAVAELAASAAMGAEAATAALRELVERGLAERDAATGAFRFAPRDAARDAAVQQLATLHETSRHDVMRMMSANAVLRLRASALRAFTDAFLLRKDKKDG